MNYSTLQRWKRAQRRMTLGISISHHDEDARGTTVSCPKAAVPHAGAQIHKKPVNCAWCQEEEELSMDAKTGLRRYWRTHDFDLITVSEGRTNSKPIKAWLLEQLYWLFNLCHPTGFPCQWRNFSSSSRTAVVENGMSTGMIEHKGVDYCRRKVCRTMDAPKYG